MPYSANLIDWFEFLEYEPRRVTAPPPRTAPRQIVRLALPSKGRMAEDALELLKVQIHLPSDIYLIIRKLFLAYVPDAYCMPHQWWLLWHSVPRSAVLLPDCSLNVPLTWRHGDREARRLVQCITGQPFISASPLFESDEKRERGKDVFPHNQCGALTTDLIKTSSSCAMISARTPQSNANPSNQPFILDPKP